MGPPHAVEGQRSLHVHGCLAKRMKYNFPLWSVTVLSNCLMEFTRGNNAGDTTRVSNSNQTFDVRAWKVPRCRTGRKLRFHCILREPLLHLSSSCRGWLSASELPHLWRGALVSILSNVAVPISSPKLLKAATWTLTLRAQDFPPFSQNFPCFFTHCRTLGNIRQICRDQMVPRLCHLNLNHGGPASLCCLAETFRFLPRQLYTPADHDRGAITHNQQKFFHGHIYIATVPVQSHRRVVQIRQQERIHMLTSHDTQQLVGLFLVANFYGRPVPALRI